VNGRKNQNAETPRFSFYHFSASRRLGVENRFSIHSYQICSMLFEITCGAARRRLIIRSARERAGNPKYKLCAEEP
jgi:hypothetical protein